MKNVLLMASLGGLLWLSAPGTAGPEKPVGPLSKIKINVGASWSMAVTCKGGERAAAFAMGDKGNAYLGLYVYDKDGNCVARHDDIKPKYLNDRAVIWYPPTTQTYTIEVRNLGFVSDTFTFVVR
jgi:hypothetical protein